MTDLVRALVLSASELGRESLVAVLEPHCEQIFQATTCAEAMEILTETPDLSLVFAEITRPEQAVFDLLAHIAEMVEPRPRVLIVTARGVEGEDRRVADLGADGYLTTPVLFRDIVSALKQGRGGLTGDAHRIRSQPVGTAYRLDEHKHPRRRTSVIFLGCARRSTSSRQ